MYIYVHTRNVFFVAISSCVVLKLKTIILLATRMCWKSWKTMMKSQFTQEASILVASNRQVESAEQIESKKSKQDNGTQASRPNVIGLLTNDIVANACIDIRL